MKRRKKTFRIKLYSIFIISMVVPSILIGVLFTVFYSKEIMTQEEKNIDYVLKSINNSMEVQFTELKNIGDTYYMHKEVFQEIEALNNPRLYENYEDLRKKSFENNYSISIAKILYMSKQEIYDVVFFPINSERQKAYYVDKNRSGLLEIDAVDYEKEDWFIEAIERNGTPVFYGNHVPSYRSGKKNEEVYSCVRAMRNMDNKKIIGVVKIDADIKNLKKAVDVLGTEQKDNILILEGKKVLASAKETENLNASYSKKGFQRINNRVYYVQSVKIPETDWKLTYLFSIQSIYRNYLLIVMFTVGVVIAAVLIAFLIYKRYSRETVDDMEHITNVFHEIQNGNLEVCAKVKSGNELHDIASAVNQMIHNLKEYIEKEYIWVIRQQKAEYQALQAQINPHFLYNTLNGFIALNRMGETKKLEKSIINLTYLFRYICNKDDETTIEKECSFLKEYMELEKLKYEERLDYMIFVDEECMDKKIPKLLLQPIVENSIVHGMGDTDIPIMITVMAKEVDTKGIGKVTVITVRDNGVGFEQSAQKDEKEHVGIENVRIRAELYTKEVIYQCVSSPGKGTKTTFVFGSKMEEGRK